MYTYAPGETIAVEIDEYIAHPGWFRISFDDDGNDDFASPKSIDPPSFMDNDTVLMDNLDMHESGGGRRKYQVKLPDVECEKCTLQVIQVMLDKPPYDPQDTGAFSNDIYYACIDLKLKHPGQSVGSADAGAPRDAAAPTGLADAGAQDGAGNSDAAAAQEESAEDPPTSMGRDAGTTRPRDAGAAKRDAASSRETEEDADEEHQHEEDEEESGTRDEDEPDEGRVENENSSSPASEDGCAVSRARTSNSMASLLMLLFVLAARQFRSSRRSG